MFVGGAMPVVEEGRTDGGRDGRVASAAGGMLMRTVEGGEVAPS